MSEENDGQQAAESEGFKPITSQEELNRLIGQRIAKVESRFGDYEDVKAKAAKFDEAQEAAKSDLEKATARAEAAESKVKEYEQRTQIATWKSEIVKDSKVPAEALRGTTREELEEHFEALKGLISEPAATITRKSPASGAAKPSDGDSESRRLARALFGGGN